MSTLNTNILDTGSPVNLLTPPAPAMKPVTPQGMRGFGDVDATRQAIYDRVFDAASRLEPVTNQTHTLRLAGVEWADPDRYSKKKRKEAILAGQSLGRRLRGTWELVDNTSGNVLESRKATIARIPYLTEGGTFVHRGNEYSIKHQQRLRPGVFTRIKDNGEIEAHANVLPGKGVSHRYFLDPAKGKFFLRLGQSKIPLMPLLKAMGASENDIRAAWGNDLYAANYGDGDGAALRKLKERLVRGGNASTPNAELAAAFERMELDPEVTKRTLGQPFDRLSKEAILETTKKLLAVSREEAEVDDRDHLAYQTFLGPEDLFAERLSRDRGNLRRRLLFKSTGRGGLHAIPAAALQEQIDSALLESGLGQGLEEINPAEIFDKQTQMSRLGEGGIPSVEAVPDEARAVQPSHYGFMDPLRTPESFRVGVDVYLASNARKGSDGKLYSEFRDLKTGKNRWLTPQDAADMIIGFPGSMQSDAPRVPAMVDGKIKYVKKDQVQLELPAFENAFSPLGNLIPLKSMVKGQRVAMASRMTTQALPLTKPEAPWVQAAMPGSGGSRSYEDEYGSQMGAIRASQAGRVVAVGPDAIKVRYNNGATEDVELYNNHPYNRKTFVHQTPAVQPGQAFNGGDLLARSNYTDDTGASALGLNARVAYVPWAGANFEDAIVISEGMAKRLSSEHMYQHDVEVNDRTRTGKKSYISLFPSRYSRDVLSRMDDDGVIKPGTEVHYGDPLILAATERPRSQNKLHKKRQPGFQDATVTWKHHDPGVVTDVVQTKEGPRVLVRATQPMQVGDKLSGRYGDKGVIASIIPDHKMPQDRGGQPFEVLLNPLGIISRTNPAQKVEAALGKLAAMRGKPIKVEDFGNVEDMTAWADEQLRRAGLSNYEGLIDPETDRKIPNVFTGNRFFMKLHHTAESKGQGRGSGGYTAEDTPAKGGETGSKRMALLDVNALLSHGATEVLRDASAIRGQKNEDYWLQFMSGHSPRPPRVPMVYEKFVNELKAAGINVLRQGSQTNIMALTDKDIDELAGDRVITSGDTVKFDKDLEPVKGGLFDPGTTGGHRGNRWAAIKLPEPMPNPVMEEPIRRTLGLTRKAFEDVIAGRENLPKFGSGPSAIAKALDSMNLDREIAIARARIKDGTKAARDEAVRKLGYLKSAKRLGIHPREWMLNKVPVLPPSFRPISRIEDKQIPLVSDANFLYKELIEASDNYSRMKGEVGDAGLGDERLGIYHAFKAVTGLGNPITEQSREQNVRGILKQVFGSSPKLGTVQRKLISSTVDNVGRAVITPNPGLDMDSVGLPEDKAFEVYGRFVARQLTRKGMPLTQALRNIKDRTPLARKVLIGEMEQRPVIINRAPVLHRFGIMAFRPQLTKGDTLQVSPLIVKGFNADFDGDAMNYHVPVDEEARKEALDRMLPSRQLLSPADFKSPVHIPGQEYVGGLYAASSGKSKRPARTFRNAEDARKAWLRGEIAIDDRVKILEQR